MELYRREQYLAKIRGFYHDTDIIEDRWKREN